VEFATESSLLINFGGGTLREKQILKHLSVEQGVDESKRELDSEKDFIFFLHIQGEKLSDSVPDTTEETAVRRLLCWAGREQTDDSTGLVKRQIFTSSHQERDTYISLFTSSKRFKRNTYS